MLLNKLPEIISMSDMIFEPVWALKFHKDSVHELLHIVKGHVDLTLEDGLKFHAAAGDSLIIPKDTLHKDVFDFNDDLKIFIIQFQWDLLDKYTDTVTFENINDVDNTLKSDLKRIFDQMRFDSGYGDIDREIANARLLTAFLLIYRGITTETAPYETKEEIDAGKNRCHKLVIEAKRYLKKNFREPVRLVDVAEHLQVSPFYLSRVFARESDFSLTEYLTDIRLTAAKELLLDGRYIVADIARMVGYQDGNYFSKVFKRMLGCSPSKYR